MSRARKFIASLLTVVVGLLAAAPARAAWQNSFSGFAASLGGDLYTPTRLAASPAILVAIHMCTGHSSTVHGWFDSYADTNGFYIVAPDAGKTCFDASASRDGDKLAIVTMVNYLLQNKNADATRVFAAGMSTGGSMANTLLAVYPDVFAGSAAMPGFPAGAWPAGDTTCTMCGVPPSSTDGAYWGDKVRSVFSWSGPYGCSQQWVGGGDQYDFNGWLPAVAAQFQNLSNLDAGSTVTGRSGWTRVVYKDGDGNVRLETNLGPVSQKHDLETVSPPLYGDVITFLGLDQPTGACGITNAGTGGASGSGGAPAGSGGVSSAGGAPGTGGVPGTGGTPGSGGVPVGTGGTPVGSGGVAAGSGGVPGSGGAGTGGTPGTGGRTGAGGGNAGGKGVGAAGGTVGAGGRIGTDGTAGMGVASGSGGVNPGTGGGAVSGGSGGESGGGAGMLAGTGAAGRGGGGGPSVAGSGGLPGMTTAGGTGGQAERQSAPERGLYQGSPCTIADRGQDFGFGTIFLAAVLLASARRRSVRRRSVRR